MSNQANKKRSVQEAKEAAETVARLGSEMPPADIQRIYDEVVFELVAKTKLAAKMKAPRSKRRNPLGGLPAEDGLSQ